MRLTTARLTLFLAVLLAPLALCAANADAQTLDERIHQYNSQPVEDTLADSDVVPVTDATYNDEVLSGQGPAMVLFYYSGDDNQIGCQGLAAMAVILADMFPELRFYSYYIEDFADLTRESLNELTAKYPLNDAPGLLIYDDDSGRVEFVTGMHGGVIEEQTILTNIAYSSYFITREILD